MVNVRLPCPQLLFIAMAVVSGTFRTVDINPVRMVQIEMIQPSSANQTKIFSRATGNSIFRRN